MVADRLRGIMRYYTDTDYMDSFMCVQLQRHMKLFKFEEEFVFGLLTHLLYSLQNCNQHQSCGTK